MSSLNHSVLGLSRTVFPWGRLSDEGQDEQRPPSTFQEGYSISLGTGTQKGVIRSLFMTPSSYILN